MSELHPTLCCILRLLSILNQVKSAVLLAAEDQTGDVTTLFAKIACLLFVQKQNRKHVLHCDIKLFLYWKLHTT